MHVNIQMIKFLFLCISLCDLLGMINSFKNILLHFLDIKKVSLSRVQLFATPWTIQSMEFSRPQYWTEWPFPSPGDLPNPGIEPRSPTLQADSLPAEPQGKPILNINI